MLTEHTRNNIIAAHKLTEHTTKKTQTAFTEETSSHQSSSFIITSERKHTLHDTGNIQFKDTVETSSHHTSSEVHKRDEVRDHTQHVETKPRLSRGAAG